MLISWCVMALTTFQEFETAALMQIDRHPVAWSVWLFDAHAARQPLTDSLRMIVVPLTCEVLLLSPALYLLLRRRGHAPSAPDGVLSGSSTLRRSHSGMFIAAAVVSPGILLMLIWPVCTNLRITALGFVSILTQGSVVRQSIQQILTSTMFAGAATFLAMTVVSRLCSGTRRMAGSAGARWLLALLLAPGLSGSLVMSVLLLALFQLPGVRIMYDTWLPMLLGQTMAVVPKTLAVVFLLQKTTDRAALYSASLLLASSDVRTRRHGSLIRWRMSTGRWLLGGLVVAHWCFWDVTVASILRPVQLEPVVTRLYNEMHYGRTEALMSLSILAAMTPLFVWMMAALWIRLSHRLIGPFQERKSEFTNVF
jgi:ABC-type spermidine/putrescine transport system permease subunit II